MNGTLRNAGTGAPFAAIYFILFHLLVTVVSLDSEEMSTISHFKVVACKYHAGKKSNLD